MAEKKPKITVDEETITEIKRVADLTTEPLKRAKKLLAEADSLMKFGDFPATERVELEALDEGDHFWSIEAPELCALIHSTVRDWHVKRATAARDEAEQILKDLPI